ncbi:MAG TPA: acyl-CoA dehydrogenase family protein [Kofleriaceae bacterium]|nr:acyl-CoA dehydrogenase family protein [Kofleriaceae bacterium]
MRLSTDDLDVFFEDRHRALAGELGAAAPAIEAAERGAPDADGRARAVAAEMGRLGLYRWLLPESGSVDVRALCLVREMLGQVSPLGDAIFAVQGLGSYPLLIAGSGEQRALGDALRAGEAIAAFALTEPGAGSDVASIATSARRDGDGWVLEGEKTFISSAGLATHYLVFATVDPAARRKGITAFWVPADTPGLTVRPIALGIEHPIGELTFAGCRVPAGAQVGEAGEGFALAMRTLDTFRLTVGAAACGMARRAFDAARAHVTGRVQFGAPLSDTQLVQAHLADMACDLDAARLLVLRAALVADRGQPVTVPAAMAKLCATEAAQRVIDRAVQLFGGRGVRQGEVVEALYRAIRPLRIYEGTSEIQRIIIGRALAREARRG